MAKQYKSEALAAAHETTQGLADAGVMAKRTMKALDEMCLPPVEHMPPAEDPGAPSAGEREPSGVRRTPSL